MMKRNSGSCDLESLNLQHDDDGDDDTDGEYHHQYRAHLASPS